MTPKPVVHGPHTAFVTGPSGEEIHTDEYARIRAKLPLAEKAKIADYVIDNSGTPAELRARADEVLDALCRRLGVDPARYPLPD